MNQDDLIIQREVRRVLEKRPIDASLAVVTHNKGFITVGGTIRALRSQPFVHVQDEIATFQLQTIRSFPRLKGVSIEAKVIELPKKKKPIELELEKARGATSHTPTT